MSSRFILPFADVGSGLKPSSGAQLFFFATGTSTEKDTFSDLAATTPNTNPVIANAVGVFPDIFITGSYKVILKDKNDVQEWEADPVTEVATDLINDLSQAYEFPTVAAMTSSVIVFPVGKVLKTAVHNTTSNAGGSKYVVTAGASPESVGSPALTVGFYAKLIHKSYIKARKMGAIDNIDNTLVIDACIAESATYNKIIDWGNSQIETSTPHTASTCIGMISTGKAKITATYEQVGDADKITNSLFLVDGKDKFSAKDFEVAYTGTYDTGLVGGVCGIYIINSDDVVVDNIYGHDFNHSAVSVGFEGADCLNPRIENNRFVHNRLAGGFLGHSDMALITKNLFRENGLIGDNGTGYGFACLSATSVKNVTVTNNRTYKNARRGLDLHSHQTALVTDNICYKDVIAGIYAVTRGNAARSLTVTNNIVFCDDQTVNVELAYTGIQLGVSGAIATSGGVPTIIEGNNQVFNLTKDFGVTNIAAENVVGLSFVNGLATGESFQVLSSFSQLRGVDFKPIVSQFTTGDTSDVKINNHSITGVNLHNLVVFEGEGTNLGRREVTELDVRATSVVGDNITVTGGFSSVRFEENYLNGEPLDSVIVSDLGYEKTYQRKSSLLAGVPKLVFDSMVKGEVATVEMTCSIQSTSAIILDIAALHGFILAGWSNDPNANIQPLYTELVNTSRTSNAAGLGVSTLNPVVTAQRNETGGNFRSLEVLLTTDIDSTAYIKFNAIGPIMSLTV
jgi:hypothetical protein